MALYSLFHFPMIFIILLLPLLASAQNNGNITAGTSLTAGRGSPWLSPSEDFAFGFRQLEGTDQFLMSIWFDKIPDKTIVWYANGTKPVSRGATVELDARNGLVLRDAQGKAIWNIDGIVDQVAYGRMTDTGNFQLVRSDSVKLWQSFSHPTDTILPNQTIEIGGMLISRQSERNFSQGRFYLRMLENGNLMLSTKLLPSNTEFDDDYYNSLTSATENDPNSAGDRLVYSDRGSIYILRRNNQQELLSPRSIPSTSEYYHRATLNFDGVFTQYYHPRSFSGQAGWVTGKFWPENICVSIDGDKGSGACGYNNVCGLRNGRPVCECPKGFVLVDQNNKNGDCDRNFTQSCFFNEKEHPEDLYEMVEITDTDWPKSDFQLLTPCAEEDCKRACLNDCLCAVAIYRSNSCWKKKLPLSNGRIDTNINAKAFLKFRKGKIPILKPNMPVEDKGREDRGALIVVGSVLLGGSLFINFVFIFVACIGCYLVYNKKIVHSHSTRDEMASNLRCFTFKEVAEATNGFKEELGRGSFGIVYKGVIGLGSKTMVAVKKLDRVAQDAEKEFKNEVNVIGQTHHKNLVRLLGYCGEGHHRLLVYEYMSNGTLASFLFGDPKPSWNQRTQLAFGVARGLLYLHEECSTQIIHCDIKPQNILLDEYYNARISDFGLSKLLMMNQSRTQTNIRGTKGYVAPEWFRNTPVSAKVDVYSFGVLLMEIITCRRSLNHDVELGEEDDAVLTDWVWDCYQEKRWDLLVQNDAEPLADRRKLERFVKVSIWCVQEDYSLRPTMKKAGQMLEGVVEVAVPPCPFPFSSTT